LLRVVPWNQGKLGTFAASLGSVVLIDTFPVVLRAGNSFVAVALVQVSVVEMAAVALAQVSVVEMAAVALV
jgi:hypothetical protein